MGLAMEGLCDGWRRFGMGSVCGCKGWTSHIDTVGPVVRLGEFRI